MTDTIQPSNTAQLQDDAPRRGATPLLWILLAVALLALAWWLMAQRNLGAGTVDTTSTTAAAVPTENSAPAATPARVATKRSSAPARASARGDAASVAAAGSLSAELLAHDTPRYPTAALRSGTEGTVMLRIDVDASGVPTDIGYAQRSGDRDLDRAALQAAQDWRFRPARRDGHAVASTVNVPVRFTLPASARG